MKRLLGLSLLAGAVALAIVIGQRMSTDAMAVTIGVVFGVAASIPTGLLIALAVSRTRASYDASPYPRRDEYPATPPPPTVYVINPNQLPAAPATQQLSAPQPFGFDIPVPRQWVVVGDETEGYP